MRYKRKDESKPVELEKTVIEQFRRYLSEIRAIESLTPRIAISWWDQ